MARLDWNRKTIADHVVEQEVASESREAHDRAVMRVESNAKDREHLAALLDLLADEDSQAAVLLAIEWLEEGPDRFLGTALREMIDELALLGSSKQRLPTIADITRRIAWMKARHELHENSRPGWMKDPSLLPKKPPPIAPGGDDE